MNVTRRNWLRMGAGALAQTCVGGLSAVSRKPNILIILADDLGYADVASWGGKDVPTPHIDSIVQNGVRFTNAYVSGPYCSPTRAGLMTGRYQQRFGHEFNAHTSKIFFEAGGKDDNLGLPLTETTVATRMKNAGYATGIVGKWHLGDQPKFHPNRRGFDEFFGFLGGARQYIPVDQGVGRPEVLRNQEKVKWEGYLTDHLGREAASFIDRHQRQPFFLYLAFNAVHTPMQAPEETLKRFAHIADPRRRTYAAMLSKMDDAVGVVLTRLRERKLEKDTLIFFLSDNGGPTNKYAVNGSSNGPLRGSKGDTWEGGIRVPFAVQWKGTLPAGRVYHQPVIQLDITATALALGTGGLRPEWKIEGVNLIPFVTGKRKDPPHKALYWRFGDHFAVRAGDWKLLHTWDTKQPQLHNLRGDIGESKDLAAVEPAKTLELKAAWDEWNRGNVLPAWPRPDTPLPQR